MAVSSQTCFLLNYGNRDRNGRLEIILNGITAGCIPVRILIDTFRPLFFVPRATPRSATSRAAERKELNLRAITNGSAVDCLYFSTYSQFLECGRTLREQGFEVFESDVHPPERYLMERFVRGGFEATGQWAREKEMLVCRNPQIRGALVQPELSTLSLDIETNARTDEILSIACCGKSDMAFTRGERDDSGPVRFCRNERELIERFFAHLRAEDPDALIGWNIIDFDLYTLQERCSALRLPFGAGRGENGRIVQGAKDGKKIARIPGRVAIDVPSMLRMYFHPFEEYSLDFVATTMLGRGKTIQTTGAAKIDEINRLAREDPLALARYNLLDAQLTKEIFDRAGILPVAIERSKNSGHLIDRVGGNVAAFDFLYLPLLHRAGYVAPDAADAAQPTAPLPGGYILEPKPGMYENVLVFDFRSLYPSIIMTFKIDPLGLVAPSPQKIQGPVGPPFAADVAILPSIIARLMEARSQAKKENNQYLSQAIKILMNSFYGVLGANGCRFFSTVLSSSITQCGQYLLKLTIEHIQTVFHYPVIYGDTDSLFVLLGKEGGADARQTGARLAREVTQWLAVTLKERFGVESALELQFERHFRDFFMPSIRGTSQGSKKHYCGTVADDSGITLIFKGMESARSDWTDLAKEFQQELLLRAFEKRPFDGYVIATVDAVRKGALDEKLVYKKRLRKHLDEYTDHVPPHVQAAKLLAAPGHLIRYYVTLRGPQPMENRTAPIDYEHYIDTQLRPVADSILEWFGTNFEKIVSDQQDLFGK